MDLESCLSSKWTLVGPETWYERHLIYKILLGFIWTVMSETEGNKLHLGSKNFPQTVAPLWYLLFSDIIWNTIATSVTVLHCSHTRTFKKAKLIRCLLKFCFIMENHLQVGDSYMVYENEIFHNRQLIPDGPTFISRDSNFK